MADAAEKTRAKGVGGDVRALRKARGLTLAALGARVGRSVGWLSEVERGVADPALPDLRRLAIALDAPLSVFFGATEAPPEERGRVVRAGARRRLGEPGAGLAEELLSPDLTGAFEIVLSTFAPGAELPEPARRPTEEAGYLVSGALDLELGGRWHALAPGDSFRIVDEPFRWRCPGPDPAVAVWVIAPPVY